MVRCTALSGFRRFVVQRITNLRHIFRFQRVANDFHVNTSASGMRPVNRSDTGNLRHSRFVHICFIINHIRSKMEKKKNSLTIIGHSLVLALFAATALASSSSKETIRSIDDAVDGYQYGRSLFSDANDADNSIETDSIATELPLVAAN